jgi:predicted RNA-binding protein with TRAM domain
MERRLRALVAGSRSQAYRVELAAPIASALIGPGAKRLVELEALTKRRFFLEGKSDMHLDHFVVLAEGKLADMTPASPVAEGAEMQVELVEVDRHDATAAVAKVDGIDVVVGEAAQLVGKRVKVRIERVLDGTAYAAMTRKTKVVEPLTAEAEAEKPTRKPPARKDAESSEGGEVEDAEDVEEVEEVEEVDDLADEPEVADGATPAKKKTRRGSRGGRNRKKPAGATAAATGATAAATGATAAATTIHLPPDDLGEAPAAEKDEPAGAQPSENGDAPATPAKKKTRRGSRGGKNRRKRTAAATAAAGGPALPSENGSENGSDPVLEAEPQAEETATQEEEWGYVPMSEWGDEIES